MDCTCFNKTGTITEDGMEMWRVLPVQRGHEEAEDDVGWKEPVQEITCLKSDILLVVGMATCHELNIIGGEMRGDPLDEKMFSSTGWQLEMEWEEQSKMDQLSMYYMKFPMASTNSVIQAAPQKLFQFSSDMQRMSVVIRVVEEQQGGFTEPRDDPETLSS